MRESGVSKASFPHMSTTIFVDNLPQHIHKIWVFNLFRKFGKLRDIFIPTKKSKIIGQNFGFVRFFKREDAEVAVAETHNSWCWDHRLMVKFARFLKEKDDQGLEGNPFSFNKRYKHNPQFPFYKGTSVYHLQSLHAKDLPPKFQNQNHQKEKRGKEVWRRKGIVESSIQGEIRNAKPNEVIKSAGNIKVLPTGNGWLLRSAIAKVCKLVSTEDLLYIFRKEGVNNIQIKSIGGRFVIVIFPDMNLRDSIIKKRWISNWFEEIKPGNGEQAKEERFVWLSCFGMPLNAWSVPMMKETAWTPLRLIKTQSKPQLKV